MAMVFEGYLGLLIAALGLLSLAVSNRSGMDNRMGATSRAARLIPLAFLALVGVVLIVAYLLGIDLAPGAGLLVK